MTIRFLAPVVPLALQLLLFVHVDIAQTVPADTIKIDTLMAATRDSLGVPRIPIPLVGSIDRSLQAQHFLPDSLINFQDYRYLGDLLEMTPGMFVRSFGSPGQWQQISIGGVDARSIQFMSDGVPLNDAYTGLFDLSLYPTENIGRMEYVTGTRAFLYGLNSTGGAINLVTKSKKAIHPYSRLRYSESGYGYSLVDGMFSQDLIRGLNLTAGAFHNTFGGRFVNSIYDQWNGRFKLRYNLSNVINVFASEMYNQTNLGLWGGIDSSTPPAFRFDRIQATIRNGDAYEKISRHDVQAGIATRYTADSSSISTMTFFYSTQLREYRDEENRPSPNRIFLQENQDSRWFGARFQHEQHVGNQRLQVGAEFTSRRALITPATDAFQKTQNSLFGIITISPGDGLLLEPYCRLESNYGLTRFSYGGDANMHTAFPLELFGGYSRSYRYPTLQEFILPSNIVSNVPGPPGFNGEPEDHIVGEIGIRWNGGNCGSLEMKGFYRKIEGAIVASPLWVNRTTMTLSGFTETGSLRLGSFVLEGETQYLDQVSDDATMRALPRWSATGGIYFWDTLVSGHLHLKVGMRGHAFSSYFGQEFDTRELVYNPNGSNGQGSTIDPAGAADFFLIAHLGDAYIHFIMENLFDRQYIMYTFYPMTDRTIRFGVSWEFAD